MGAKANTALDDVPKGKLRKVAVQTDMELLEFVRQRVDEPPARPKSVTILQTMPMTSVGKIFGKWPRAA